MKYQQASHSWIRRKAGYRFYDAINRPQICNDELGTRTKTFAQKV